MRRSGNLEETKRVFFDLEVVLKSHDCPYIVQCLGCFVTDSDVWICMELMATCLDKLTKRYKRPIPEPILGKISVAVSTLRVKSSVLFIHSCQLASLFKDYERPDSGVFMHMEIYIHMNECIFISMLMHFY